MPRGIRRCARGVAIAALAVIAAAPGSSRAQPAPEVSTRTAVPPTLHIARVSAPIRVDGALDDPGWSGVTAIEEWYETNPGDNTPPKVRNRGWLAYDDAALYVGLEFEDPAPDRIRAAVTDRDNVSRESDYGGVVLDPSGAGRTGMLMLVNPRGTQYDSILDDGTGIEDKSPDFFWTAASRITDRGWTAEIRIPFSSLSYSQRDPQVFRLMLYRNYPRDFRYQFFTTQIPRDSPCFICRTNTLVGLTGLPAGGGIVIAPYVSGSYVGQPGGNPGSKLRYGDPEIAGGVDAKWRPSAGTVVDVTINPDFSQIESDVAQITANERFALSYPEKRPFFLEGVQLLTTPIAAVATRSLTDPQWGARDTTTAGRLTFTALAVQDEGGGQVILPGASSSTSVDQQFRSWAGIARMRYSLGNAFVGAIATTREIEGGGFNRLGGPDFQWQLLGTELITGQYLYSLTRTPDRPDLTPRWDGRAASGGAGLLRWSHAGSLLDVTAQYRDLNAGFRADDGFVPQVGIREVSGETGLSFRPDQGALRRFRAFASYDRVGDRHFDRLSQNIAPGVALDALLGSTLTVNYAFDQILVAGRTLTRHQAAYMLSLAPGRFVTRIDLIGTAGQQIDFDNARVGSGVDASLTVRAQPTPHLELVWDERLRWIDVGVEAQPRTRLFTAHVDRLRATYSFTPGLFLRVTAQYQATSRSPELYLSPVTAKDADFAASLLFAYKINWQSVLFVGYGDNRTFSTATGELVPSGRQLFFKLSHAFQL